MDPSGVNIAVADLKLNDKITPSGPQPSAKASGQKPKKDDGKFVLKTPKVFF
jgi:hypothetical protein